MKLQPASVRELKRISLGVLIGSAVMLAVFAIVRRFDWTVLTGALLGVAVAIFNFFYLCISVQKAAAADETRAHLIMRSSYTRRMLINAAAMVIGFATPWFHPFATLIPLFLPRVTILFMQLTGLYKPDGPVNDTEEG